MSLNEIRGEVSQGDVFDSLPLAIVTQESGRQVLPGNARAIFLTYDCEYDKPSTQFAMVAGVFSLTEVPTDRQGNVRKNKIFSTFYLPAPFALMDHLWISDTWGDQPKGSWRIRRKPVAVSSHWTMRRNSRSKSSFLRSSAMDASVN